MTAIAAELVLGRITYGQWLHPASAYISGISVGILVRSPFLWPYFFASLISILSKYVLRLNGRHLWNPSNFGVSAVLFLAPQTVSLLSIQWGNNLWPMAVIWLLGFVIVWRVGRLHVSATYVVAFVVFAFVRSAITGNPWQATLAPITGPMYQLFIFFMVTDPKVAVRPKWGQVLVVDRRRVRRDAAPAERGDLRAVLRAVSGRAGGVADRDGVMGKALGLRAQGSGKTLSSSRPVRSEALARA